VVHTPPDEDDWMIHIGPLHLDCGRARLTVWQGRRKALVQSNRSRCYRRSDKLIVELDVSPFKTQHS